MVKKHLFAAGAALALCSAGAYADPFSFNPTGNGTGSGDIQNLGLFDQAPGNSLAIGGASVFTGQVGSNITVLYQANLSTANNITNSPVFLNGTSGNYFTFVAGFGETLKSIDPTGNNATFSFNASSTTNFFKVYATSAAGNDLTGTGFTNGTLIMSGTFLPSNFTSGYNRTLGTSGACGTASAGCQNFDQSADGDQYSGKQSVTGIGSTAITSLLNFVDADYFPDLVAGASMTFFNTSQNTPFTVVDPSQAFINLTGTASAVTAPDIGAANGGGGPGVGPNFQLQADANQSFTRPMPEPDSLAMLGLGLSAAALVSRRRRGAKQAA